MSETVSAAVRGMVWAQVTDRWLPATVTSYERKLARAWAHLDLPVWHHDEESPVEDASFPSREPFTKGQKVLLKLKSAWKRTDRARVPEAYDARDVSAEEHAECLSAEAQRLERLLAVDEAVVERTELERYRQELDEAWAEARADRQEADAALKAAEAERDVLDAQVAELRALERHLTDRARDLEAALRRFETSGGRAILEALEADRPTPAPTPSHGASITTPEGWRAVQAAVLDAGYQMDPMRLERLLLAFVTAAAAGELLILGGPPGSGKTSAIDLLARATSSRPPQVMPVRPGWLDSTDLLGYLDPQTNEYRPTDLVDVMVDAAADTDVSVVLLDEMNIARIENYGADLLATLEKAHEGGAPDGRLRLYPEWLQRDAIREFERAGESGASAAVRRSAASLLRYPPRLPIPTTILFAGTLNDDATTHAISPKVRDRALVVPMAAPSDAGSGRAVGATSQVAVAAIADLKAAEPTDELLTQARRSLAPIASALDALGAEPSRRFHRALRRAVGLSGAVGLDVAAAVDVVVVTKALAPLQFLKSDSDARIALGALASEVETAQLPWATALLADVERRFERGDRLVTVL